MVQAKIGFSECCPHKQGQFNIKVYVPDAAKAERVLQALGLEGQLDRRLDGGGTLTTVSGEALLMPPLETEE